MTIIRRVVKLASIWEAENPVIPLDVEVIEIDDVTGEQRSKLGDGETEYNDLPYFFNPSGGLAEGSVTTETIVDGAVTEAKVDASIASATALALEADTRASADLLLADIGDPRFTDDRVPVDGSVTTVKMAPDVLGRVIEVPDPATTWGPFTHDLGFTPTVTCVTSADDVFWPDTVNVTTTEVVVTLAGASAGKLILS